MPSASAPPGSCPDFYDAQQYRGRVKPNEPFPPQVASVMESRHSNCNLRKVGTSRGGVAVTDPTMFREDRGRTLELWAGRAIECGGPSGLLCRRVEGKNVESRSEGGGLACEASEGSLKSIRAVCSVDLGFCGSGQLGLQSQP